MFLDKKISPLAKTNYPDVGFDRAVTQQHFTGQTTASHLESSESPHTPRAEKDDSTPKPLRRVIMPTTITKRDAHHGPWLHARLGECPGEGELRGLIRGEEHFRTVYEQYSALTHHEPMGYTPTEDPTMPTTDESKVRYVDRLLNAIADFSDVETECDTTSEMIESVVRVKLSLIELNLLCWKVLVSLLWCVQRMLKGDLHV